MRTLLRAALGCTVMAGALFAAGPAHAAWVCTTAPNGAEVCYDNGAGGTAPGSGGVGGGGSNDIALPPPVPAAPAPYVPPAVNVPPPAQPAPYVAPKPPAQQAPVYVAPAQAPAQVNVPAYPAPAPNQPVKGFDGAENPVIAGVPAEAPAAEAAPTGSAAAVTPSPSSSATPTPSPSATPATGVTLDQSASTSRFEPWPFILSGLLIAALITVLVARARTSRRTPEAGHGGSMEAGSSDA